MKVRRINDWTFEDEFLDTTRPMVVLFVSAECRACEQALREYHLLAEDYDGVAFREVDLLENPSLASKLLILRVPTTIVYLGGVEVARHVGPGIIGPVRRALAPSLGKES